MVPSCGRVRGHRRQERPDEARLFHHADPSARQGLAAVAARGPRGLHARRRARLRRRLCRRARDRPGREHHLLRDVHRHAGRRDQAHQARHRHGQHAEQPSGRGRGARSRCSTTCSTAASSSASARAACCRTPRCSAISTPTATRCSSRRSTRCWRSGPASRPTTSRASTGTISTERTLMPEIGQGFLPKPLQKPHPPIVVTAVAPFSKGVTEAAARGWEPISANFLMPEWVKSHWPKYVEGCERGGPPGRSRRTGASPRASSSPTTTRPPRPTPPIRTAPIATTTAQLFTKLKTDGRVELFKTRRDQPDERGHARHASATS